MPERKWYDSTWALVASLILCFPVGFVLVWRKPWKTATKAIIMAAVLVVGIAAAASSSTNGPKKAASTTTTPKTTTTVAPKRVVVTTTTATTPATTRQTAPPTTAQLSRIDSSVDRDARSVAAEVTDVQVAVGIAAKSNTQADLNTAAQVAQQAHDDFVNMRDQMALDNVPVDIEVALNDLKNSMGALVAYTGDPNPATLAHFTSQYQTGVEEWNAAVIAAWNGHAGKPPTIATS